MTGESPRSVVRNRGRSARKAIVGQDRVRAERRLISHLQSVAAIQRGSVGVFVAHDGEPDLSPLVHWLWDREQIVALPVLNDDPNDFSMRFVPWHRGDPLGSGRFGIPVPPEEAVGLRAAIDPSTLLVSLVGFDRFGNRMGRGAGFFDRYLATTRAAVVGVGFEAQRFGSVPVESHDVPMPAVVTDAGVRNIDLLQIRNQSE